MVSLVLLASVGPKKKPALRGLIQRSAVAGGGDEDNKKARSQSVSGL